MRMYNLLKDILLVEQDEENPEEDVNPDEESPDDKSTPEENIENPEEELRIIDKAYILKKIYSRLIATSKILDYESGSEFDELKSKTLEAIDLFHIIVSNFDKFQDKLDEIIKGFYKFLEKIAEELDKIIKER
jgi:hypothetical protein